MTPHTPSPPPSDRDGAGAPDPNDASAHPDVETLADLAEDLLDPADAAPLRQHLTGCPDCADTYAALTEVALLLGADPAPTMPEDVADRIDAALAAAAAERTPAPEPGTPAVAPARTAPPGGPAGPSRPGAGTGRGPATGPGRPRRRRTGRILLGTAALAAVLSLGSLLITQPWQSGAGPASSAAGSDSGHAAALAPGNRSPKAAAEGAPEYREDQLAQQVRDLLASASAPAVPGSHTDVQPGIGAEGSVPPGTATGSPTAPTSPPPACVTLAAGHPGRAPLAAGPGRYGTDPVTALVYPLDGRTDLMDVYLVTPDCPGAKVLLHRTVPAP
ncbi:zf-HC2 domain-containing protein [Kitasatospora sp. NPDC088346]|uniref:zf-HC2 domain-containing protein n=1 Tax=Kitasatospora sp. NPDC088346 TaxID=3364073 RepID=UPI00382B5549